MEDCPFCSYTGPSKILREYEGVFIIEPINPVTPGHVLVVPVHHVTDFADDPMLTCKVMAGAASYVKSLMPEPWDAGGPTPNLVLGADTPHWNLITSKGALATQTVRHLHVHLVPRRENDGLMLPWSGDQAKPER